MAHSIRTSASPAPSVRDAENINEQPAVPRPAHSSHGGTYGFSLPSGVAHPLRTSHSPVPSIVSHDGEAHELEDFHQRPTAPGPADSQESLLPGEPPATGPPPRPNYPLKIPGYSGNVQQLSKGGLFFILTILAAAMLLINLIQIALLDRLHSIGWIVVVPLVVFILSLSLISAFAFASQERLMRDWGAASRPQKVAWVGIVIAIFANIIICEFIYLPFFALHNWHKTDWKTTMDVYDSIQFPAIVIAWTNSAPKVDFFDPECKFYNGSVERDCQTTLVPQFSPNVNSTGQYLLFNPKNQTYNVTNDSLDGSTTHLTLTLNMTYDSGLADAPNFYVGAFDPNITFSWSDFVNVCGNPPLYYCILPQITQRTALAFHAETKRLDDRISALVQERHNTSLCSQDVLTMQNYTYYTGRYDPFPGENIVNSKCDAASKPQRRNAQQGYEVAPDDDSSSSSTTLSSTSTGPSSSSRAPSSSTDAPSSSVADLSSTSSAPSSAPSGKIDTKAHACQVWIQIYMASSLVTTQTSSHGTDTMKILTDQGGILGGIAFVTWFFSIFAV